MATGTAPSQWIDEPDEILATALDVLAEQHEAIQAARKGR